ncbi:MAG: hypothetical protein GF307_05810 [candidate division Zixibacteria bacterium]|nr:hypothetical protein [candidate division Zixibacteria bacterium]
MKYIIPLLIILSVISASCENPTFEPYTDEYALTDIATKDFTTLFETKLVSLEIPETTMFAYSDDVEVIHFWRNLVRSGKEYIIETEYSDTNAIDVFDKAWITVNDTIITTFNSIAEDTSAEPDTIIRLQKQVTEFVSVTGFLERLGTPYEPRNGWIMNKIGGASGKKPAASTYNAFDSLYLISLSRGEFAYDIDDIIGLDSLYNIPRFHPEEGITVEFLARDTTGEFTVHVGRGEYTLYKPDYLGDKRYRTFITTPAQSGYFHITLDAVNSQAFTDTSAYNFRRLSMVFLVETDGS